MSRREAAPVRCPTDTLRGRLARACRGAAQRLLMGLITGYQWFVSPWLAPRCRYWPCCSDYGLEAIRHWGALRGAALAGWRILRCNPWMPGGIDCVPERAVAPVSDRYLACVLRQRGVQAPSPDHR